MEGVGRNLLFGFFALLTVLVTVLVGVFMLSWTLLFLVVAIIAGVLGFGGIAAGAAGIAKILFFVFLVIFVISLVTGSVRRPRI